MLKAILRELDQPEDAFEWVRDRPGHDRRYAIDSSKISAQLEWRPMHVDFEDGLKETIAWYRDNGEWWGAEKEATEERYRRQSQ